MPSTVTVMILPPLQAFSFVVGQRSQSRNQNFYRIPAAQPALCKATAPRPVNTTAPQLSHAMESSNARILYSLSSSHRKHSITPTMDKAIEAFPKLSRQFKQAKFLAGGLAGALSAVLTIPLEVLRTQIQASGSRQALRSVVRVAKEVLRYDGLGGFYRGLGMALLAAVPSRTISFATYATVKDRLRRTFGFEGSVAHMTAAICASVTCNLAINPLSVIKTRLQINPTLYRGPGDAFCSIVKDEGLRGLYRGFSAPMWGTSEAAIQLVMYEHMKERLGRRERGNVGATLTQISPLQHSASAAASKFIASVATYPYQRVRMLMREIPKKGCAPRYTHMIQSIQLLAKEEGWIGLYRGMGCHLARSVPKSVVMFVAYEIVCKKLEQRHQRILSKLRAEK